MVHNLSGWSQWCSRWQEKDRRKEGGHCSVVGLMTVDTVDEHSVTRDEGGGG